MSFDSSQILSETDSFDNILLFCQETARAGELTLISSHFLNTSTYEPVSNNMAYAWVVSFSILQNKNSDNIFITYEITSIAVHLRWIGNVGGNLKNTFTWHKLVFFLRNIYTGLIILNKNIWSCFLQIKVPKDVPIEKLFWLF